MTADGSIVYKFDVRRVDEAETDPDSKHFGGCQYFVLDVDHDPHAIEALKGYARSCQDAYPLLAADIRRFLVERHDHGKGQLIPEGGDDGSQEEGH